jgi:Mrp family chromosome partitioning ATPase
MEPVGESFHILRVTVLNHIVLPSVIAVTAASNDDGGTCVACGLARAFAQTGRRTLIVDANPGKRTVGSELGIPEPPVSRQATVRETGFLNLSLAALPRRESADAAFDVGRFVSEMRSEYTITIIDAAPIATSSLSIEVAQAADTVLLAVRLGRRLRKADHDLRKLLADLNTNVLGVVPTRAGRDDHAARPPKANEQRPRSAQVSLLRSRRAM